MRTIETNGYMPAQEINFEVAFTSQAKKAGEIMTSGKSWETKINELFELETTYKDILEMVDNKEQID